MSRPADRDISFVQNGASARIAFRRDRVGAYVAWAILLLIIGFLGAYIWLVGNWIGLLMIMLALGAAVWLWLAATDTQFVVITRRTLIVGNLSRYSRPSPQDILIDNAARVTEVEQVVTVEDDNAPDEEAKVERTGPSSWIVWIVRVLTRRQVTDRTLVQTSVEARSWLVFVRTKGRDVRLFDRLYREEAHTLGALVQVALVSTET